MWNVVGWYELVVYAYANTLRLLIPRDLLTQQSLLSTHVLRVHVCIEIDDHHCSSTKEMSSFCLSDNQRSFIDLAWLECTHSYVSQELSSCRHPQQWGQHKAMAGLTTRNVHVSSREKFLQTCKQNGTDYCR